MTINSKINSVKYLGISLDVKFKVKTARNEKENEMKWSTQRCIGYFYLTPSYPFTINFYGVNNYLSLFGLNASKSGVVQRNQIWV